MLTTALNKYTISVNQARLQLGTSSKVYSDDDIRTMLNKAELITDIIINIINDSKIRSGIDISAKSEDN